MNETQDIVKPILAFCHQTGIFCVRRQSGAYIVGNRRVKASSASQSDLWGILKGKRHFECEVKKPGEEPTIEQLQWLTDCAMQGALSFWTTSLDDFIEVIRSAMPWVQHEIH